MAKNTSQPFPARVRFNWGYHDAVAAHTHQYPNYGFGPAITLRDPAHIRTVHPDKVYATGWLYGYTAATRHAASPLSDEAWAEAVNSGDIDPSA